MIFANGITQSRSAWKRCGEVEAVRLVKSTEIWESSVRCELPEVELSLKKFFGVKLRIIIMQENDALWEGFCSMMQCFVLKHWTVILKSSRKFKSIIIWFNFFSGIALKFTVSNCKCMILWPSGSHKTLEAILDFDTEACDACLGWCVSKLCLLLSAEKSLTHFCLKDCISRLSHRPIADLLRKCGNSKAEEGAKTPKTPQNYPKKASVLYGWDETHLSVQSMWCAVL